MNKKAAIKKFGLTMTKLHPYAKGACKSDIVLSEHYKGSDDSFKNLEFIIQLTSFEDGECGYGMYVYHTKRMTFDEEKAIHDELKPDWNRSGRRAWNSMNMIGFDLKGNAWHSINCKEA